MWPSSFFFTTCQPGMEVALKRELTRAHPELRFAFSRPGFVTFKAPEPLRLDAPLTSVFARAFGVSLGKVTTESEAPTYEGLAAATLGALDALASALPPDRPTRLHVFERDEYVPGEEPLGFVRGAQAERAEATLRALAGPSRFQGGARALAGELVVDVVLLEPDAWWLGAHVHRGSHSPFPGGRPSIVVPDDAPSRAYLKLEEVLAWSELPLCAGDTAVELGSAPGGACWSLLRHGLRVVGVDTAAMAPVVAAHPSFTQLATPAGQLLREALPRRVDWLLLDVHLGPKEALAQVARLASRMGESLRGVILTLKLKTPRYADRVPEYVAEVRSMGMEDVRAAQLPSHRRELVVVGLTARGLELRSGGHRD